MEMNLMNYIWQICMGIASHTSQILSFITSILCCKIKMKSVLHIVPAVDCWYLLNS